MVRISEVVKVRAWIRKSLNMSGNEGLVVIKLKLQSRGVANICRLCLFLLKSSGFWLLTLFFKRAPSFEVPGAFYFCCVPQGLLYLALLQSAGLILESPASVSLTVIDFLQRECWEGEPRLLRQEVFDSTVFELHQLCLLDVTRLASSAESPWVWECDWHIKRPRDVRRAQQELDARVSKRLWLNKRDGYEECNGWRRLSSQYERCDGRGEEGRDRATWGAG